VKGASVCVTFMISWCGTLSSWPMANRGWLAIGLTARGCVVIKGGDASRTKEAVGGRSVALLWGTVPSTMIPR